MRNHSPMRSVCLLALCAAFLLLLLPQTAFSQGKEKVTLKYSWIFTPTVAPFFLGLEKGYFAAEGIDLDFQDGRGSSANLKLLSAKKLQVSFADAGTTAQFINQGLTAKVVWCYMQKSPMSVISDTGAGIRTLKDLEGRKVGAAAADSGKAIFPALAKQNGVDLSKIHFVNVTPAARNTALLNHDVEAIIAYFPDNVPFLRSKGAKVRYLAYADNGVNVLGMSVIGHNDLMSKKPATLRRLIRALNRSVADSQKDPAKAVAAMKKRSPLTVKDAKTAREVMEIVLTLLHTKNSQGKPVGWMAKKDWAETIDILSKYGGLKDPRSPDHYYTNDFIPSKGTM